MKIADLEFFNFRNYEHFELSDIGDLVVLHGPNAVGKTNVLEGIHLVTAATSFRNAQIGQLVRQGSANARISAELSDGQRQMTTTLFMEAGKKRYQVNGKNKTASDIRGTLPAVSFIPDDLDLAKKSSSIKRNSLDNLGVQLSKSYNVVYRDYEKALKYKNRLLKDDSPQPLIDAINETLLTVATQLYCYRRSLFERMMPLVQDQYCKLAQSGELFGATYQPSWLRVQERFPGLTSFPEESVQTMEREDVRTYINDAFVGYNGEEVRARRAFVGPHNDQIAFELDGKDASTFASQGQQRSIVLAWKLAEVQLVEQMTGANPVLLLDDVMSELDASRRDMLVEAVGDKVQTFITATDLSSFNKSLIDRAQIVRCGD
ncbi:MAG: DNA replication and repair protein RecF [Eggerthellaceae bacterium]|nr:DNA replication and repair protein RecF [Eggerthellaceae bacterium]